MDQITTALPLSFQTFKPQGKRFGLVIVDIVNGFASVGGGNLAPQAPNPQVSQMIAQADSLARECQRLGAPVLAFLDTHIPGKPEPPYPPHCEAGTGEENLVPELAWLERAPHVTLVRKDCINGFVGATDLETGRNAVADWVQTHGLEYVLVVGICTDICVMDFVLTLLSARNHGMLAPLQDVFVHEPGCATYDLPAHVVDQLGLPATATHPQALTHHMGLYFMASRGAKLSNAVDFA